MKLASGHASDATTPDIACPASYPGGCGSILFLIAQGSSYGHPRISSTWRALEKFAEEGGALDENSK